LPVYEKCVRQISDSVPFRHRIVAQQHGVRDLVLG
jgi:hypothetical protein